MTQLILDTEGYNITLPESIKGGYRAERLPLSVDVEMITGRLVRELRGSVWTVAYQYGYFSDADKNALIAACEKGRREPITCGFLAPESSGALTYSQFIVTNFKYPTFFWSRLKEANSETVPVPMWGDFSVELREVEPSD